MGPGSVQCTCRKTPKTLSGIETLVKAVSVIGGIAEKHLKPYQGLKRWQLKYFKIIFGRKTPKTLSGIETEMINSQSWKVCAEKHLKPYQGLKQP